MAAFLPPAPAVGAPRPRLGLSTRRPRGQPAPPLPRATSSPWRAAASPSSPPPPPITPRSSTPPPPAAAPHLSPGDTIAVIGATGGVGLLTLRRLASTPGAPYTLRAVCRSAPAESLLPAGIEVVRGDIRLPAGETRGEGGGGISPLAVCLDGAAVVVVSVGTTAFPSTAWRGGNTPRAVDAVGVSAVVAALGPATTRLVLVSSVGVGRRRRFPFVVLNAFGVLDAKAEGEAAVAAWAAAAPAPAAAADGTPSPRREAVVVRPGRLTGAPQTNVGTTWVAGRPAAEEAGVVALGDTLVGDVSRGVAAEAVAWAVTAAGAGGLDFSVIGRSEGDAGGGDWLADLDSLLIE